MTRHRLTLIGALVAVGAASCSLNPQPLPPDNPSDAGATLGNSGGVSVDAGKNGSGSGTTATPTSGGDARDGATDAGPGDAAVVDGSDDAETDAAVSDAATPDAPDAGDAGL